MRRPAATLLILIAALLGAAATAAGAPAAPRHLAAMAIAASYPPELVRLLTLPKTTRTRDAKLRAERHLIDFVELMWPVLDGSGQPFVRTWVQEAICQHLEAVSDGRLTKLLVNVPPGFTKSRLVNVLWPAWEWGPKNRPDLRFMSWSYSAKLAEDQNNDCREVIESEVYQRFWGDRFKIDRASDAKSYYKNDHRGWRRSSSVQGQGTGFRADRLIFDDPHSVKDGDSEAALKMATRWFAQTLPTRTRNASGSGTVKVEVPYWVREVHGLGLEQDPDDDRPVTASATIGIMQRIHLHDVSGVILRNPALGYEHLMIEMRYKGADHPARKSKHWRGSSIGYQDPRRDYGELADPIRYPEEKVAADELQMTLVGGSDAVAAQFDQWPLEVSGSWFKMEWFTDRVIDASEVPTDVPVGKRGWDFGGGGKGSKADPSASARLARGVANKGFYLWHTATRRGSPGDVEAFIRGQHASDERSIDWSVPEDPGTGKLYADYVKRECAVGRYVASSPEAKDKITRAKPVSGQAQALNFWIVRHPGWEVAQRELVDFPYGQHDDIVDAISRAFAAIVREGAPVASHGGYAGDASGTDAVPVAAPGRESPRLDYDL
jgi:predicted phage terminase large subunit-like protein